MNKLEKQYQREVRVRNRLQSRSLLPRVIVQRSNRHFHAQVVDNTGKVLAAASSLKSPKQVKSIMATEVGKELAEKLTKVKVKAAVLDRGRYQFHGRVKAFVEALRAGHIKV